MLVLLKGEFSDDTDTIQFTLQQDDSSPVYVCQLVRQRCSADDAADDGFTYRLYVDHAPIMEHAVDAALRVGLPQDLHTTATAVAAGPPTYYETVEHDQLPPYDAWTHRATYSRTLYAMSRKKNKTIDFWPQRRRV